MEFAGVRAISAASTTTDGGVLGFKACFCSKFNNLSLRAKCDCQYMHAADWILLYSFYLLQCRTSYA